MGEIWVGELAGSRRTVVECNVNPNKAIRIIPEMYVNERTDEVEGVVEFTYYDALDGKKKTVVVKNIER